jgi:hypothetical protein
MILLSSGATSVIASSNFIGYYINEETDDESRFSFLKNRENNLFKKFSGKLSDLFKGFLERHPRLALFFNRLLTFLNRGSSNDDDGGDSSDDPTLVNPPSPSPNSGTNNDGDGSFSTDDYENSYTDSGPIIRNLLGVNEDGSIDYDNATVIPEAGHIIIEGSGSIEIDAVIDFNGTLVTLTIGSLYLPPDTARLEIWWNTTQGFFKISCDRYFELNHIYFNAGDKIIFTVESLIIDGNGHLTIEDHGNNGEFYFDGVRELTGLSFDIDVAGESVILGGSLAFSTSGETEDITISWGDNGFSADGSFIGDANLEIHDFYLAFGNLTITADLINFYSSADFTFSEAGDGTVLCNVVSDYLEISNIHLNYGNNSLSVNSIEVNGSLELVLHVSDDEYVTAEEEHISISGNVVMNIDTVINMEDGTTIVLRGDFVVETTSGSVDIWWDKDEGYFKIESTTFSIISDFHLSIDRDSWLILGWDTLIMNPNACITIENIDDDTTRLRIEGGISIITNIEVYANLNIQENMITLSAGSIHFGSSCDGYLELLSTDGNLSIFASASLNSSLAIQNVDFAVANVPGSIDSITIEGDLKLLHDDEYLTINVEGSIRVVNFSIGQTTVVVPPMVDPDTGETLPSIEVAPNGPAMWVKYFSVWGSATIIVGEGIIEIWVREIHSGLVISESPFGGLVLGIHGDAHIIWDLETGEIYGEFGFGGHAVVMGLFVTFDGEGYFSLVNDVFELWVSGRLHTSMSLESFGIPTTYRIDNLIFSFSGLISVWAHYTVHMKYNFVTGAMSFGGGVGGVAVVRITNIRLCGNLNWDEKDWEDFGVDPSSFLYSITCNIGSVHIHSSGGVIVRVFFYMGLRGGFGMTLGPIDGNFSLHGDITDIQLKYADDGNFLNVSIGKITGEIGFFIKIREAFQGFSLDINEDTIIEIDTSANLVIEDLVIEGELFNASSGEVITIDALIETINLTSGNLNISYTGEDGGVLLIEGSGSLAVSGFNLDGSYDDLEKTIEFAASIGLIDFTMDGSILYSGKNNGTLSIEGSGAAIVEGIEIAGNLNGTDFTASVDLVDFTMNGSVNIYGNGIIEVDCGASLNVEGVTITSGDAVITVSELNLDLGGHLIVQPQEDGSTVYDFDGDVHFDIDWDVSGENVSGDGDFFADGNVSIHVENCSDGNITLIDIHIDGHVNMNISFEGYASGLGNFTVDIQNFSGEGMFDFYFDVMNGTMYLNNFAETDWSCFSFSLFDGQLTADIYEFDGDLLIDDIYLDEDLKNNCSSYFEALGELLNGSFSLTGLLDPDNWTIHSESGYVTLFGFSFSNVNKTTFEGDISYTAFAINELFLVPGTSGKFETAIDENGNIRITLTCDSGYAEVKGSINLGFAKITWSVDSDLGEVYLPLGDVVRFWDDLCDQEWEGLLDLLEGFVSVWELVQGLSVFIEDIELSFIEWLISLIEENLDNIPDELLQYFLDYLDQLRDIEEDSCFLAGTQIEMADGSLKSIEDIKIGDRVVTYDAENDEWKTGVVTNIFHHKPNEMTEYYIILNNELRVTPNHPMYSNNMWVEAGELKIGDTCNGHLITSIEQVYERVPTYNFEVEPYHTYNVVWGENTRSIVHNLGSTDSQTSGSSGTSTGQTESEEAEEILDDVVRYISSDKSTCFLAETKIKMADGTVKNIEDIAVGDSVSSYDPEADSWKLGIVTEIFHHKPGEMSEYYLLINNDLGITPNHPVYIKDEWVEASELGIGDVFGGNLIVSIEKVYNRVPTYNFEVEPYHTYNVVWGIEEDCMVHNAAQEAEAAVATKYSINADAGLKTSIELSSEVMSLNTVEVVPKNIVLDNGEVFEADDFSQEIQGDNSINVYHNDEVIAENLGSSSEVTTTIQNTVTGGSSGGGDSNPSLVDTNNAPTLSCPSSKSVSEGNTCSFTATTSDIDGDSLSITASKISGPGSVSTSSGSTGYASYAIDEEGQTSTSHKSVTITYRASDDSDCEDETAKIRVKATDSHGASNSKTVTININDDDSCDDCCFPAGTMISMADDSMKAIEKVQVGEFVLSYDTKNNKLTSCRVLETVSPVREGVYDINDGLIRPTDDHPFYARKVDGRTGWAAIDPDHAEKGYAMETMKLEVGDEVFTVGGQWIKIESIEYQPGRVQTFNLEDVSGKSNFFANGILVHNAAQCSSQGSQSGSFSICSIDYNDPYLTGIRPVYLPKEVRVRFNGAGTYIPQVIDGQENSNVVNGEDGEIDRSYIWDYGDGNIGYGELPTHNYDPISHIYPPSDYGLPVGTKIIIDIKEEYSNTYNSQYNGINLAAGEIVNPVNPDIPEIGDIIDIHGYSIKYKNIEDIRVEDTVKAYDTEYGTLVDAAVTNVFRYVINRNYLLIQFLPESYEPNDAIRMPTHSILPRIQPFPKPTEMILMIAPLHRVYVNGVLTPANQIKKGDILTTPLDEDVIVTSVVSKEDRVILYDIEVETYHNYFANGILVSDQLLTTSSLPVDQDDSKEDANNDKNTPPIIPRGDDIMQLSGPIENSRREDTSNVKVFEKIRNFILKLVERFPWLAEKFPFINKILNPEGETTNDEGETTDDVKENDNNDIRPTINNANDDLPKNNDVQPSQPSNTNTYTSPEKYTVTYDSKTGTATVTYPVKLYVVDKDSDGNVIGVGVDETEISIAIQESAFNPYNTNNRVGIQHSLSSYEPFSTPTLISF